jgi:hypothetical protein
MWQEKTFDARRIDLEFGWAKAIGRNTMRVFLCRILIFTNLLTGIARLSSFTIG